jgi:sulfur carrier protein
MDAGLTVQVNGQNRSFAELRAGMPLAAFVEALGLKADRIAVELNGEIAPRTAWAERKVNEGDKLEVVHFVGGGVGSIVSSTDCQEQQQRQTRSRKGREGCAEGAEADTFPKPVTF